MSPSRAEGPRAKGSARVGSRVHARRGLPFLLILVAGFLLGPGSLQRAEAQIAPGQEETQKTGEADSRQESADGAAENVPLAEWARLHLEAVRAPSQSKGEAISRSLERIRAMYFLSVEEGAWADSARDSLSAVKDRIQPETEAAVTQEAYRGALQVVRAKHARWPPNKLKHLRRGSEILDSLTVQHPDNLEVRYLRLASYIFLPAFLRRDDSVASDLKTLARGLPDHPEAFSPTVYQGVLRFVLENGDVAPEDRGRLEEALGAPDPVPGAKGGAGAGAGTGAPRR